ncbi:WD40-repeat-containing domain protein [Baffinella frigidus]|nr:WD40-repeat-containing domain protein [Cryptophyta sp. CCMP2293]
MAVEEAGAEASNRDPQAGTEGDAGEDAAMHVEEATGGGETGEALWSQFHGHVPGRFVPYSAAAGAFRGGKLENNFLKTCRWSPDGLCVFASTEDNQIRVFELPQDADCGEKWAPGHDQMKPVLSVLEGETIYDAAWLPTMSSSDPASCLFFSTSRDNPVHIWDAFTGACQGSYCAYTDAEELTAGYSVGFDNRAPYIYVGFNNQIRVYAIDRPGRQHTSIKTFKRANRETTGQRGIVSCISFNPDKSGLFAAGSYSRNVGLYDGGTGKLLYNLQGHRGGVTQAEWSRDGQYLFTGGRKDDEILCWDVRNTGDVLLRLPRAVTTNQRILFDLDHSGRFVITPSLSSDPSLLVYDLWAQVGEAGAEPVARVPCPALANGVQIHPTLPLLAVSTGARRFPLPGEDEDDAAAAAAAAGGKRARGEEEAKCTDAGEQEGEAGPFDSALLLMRYPLDAAAVTA